MKNKGWLSQDWKHSNSSILVLIASQGRSQQQVGGRTGCGDCALGSLKGAPGRTESAVPAVRGSEDPDGGSAQAGQPALSRGHQQGARGPHGAGPDSPTGADA